MKLSISAITALVVTAASANPTTYKVEVDCDGVQHDELSAKALSFSAKALETAFNSVHKDIDDLELSQVGSTKSLFEIEKLGGEAKCSYGGSCCNCLAFSAETDSSVSSLGDSHVVQLKAFEAEFASMIAKGPFSSFEKVTKCSITMEPSYSSSAGSQLRGNSDCSYGGSCCNCVAPVTVDVTCGNVDFASLSFRALSFATAALKESFNTVHKEIDGNMLDKVALAGHRLRFGLGTTESCSYGGSCCNCGFDELFDFGMSFTGMVIDGDLSGAVTISAWEHLFLAHLLKDPKGEFEGAHSCTIVTK